MLSDGDYEALLPYRDKPLSVPEKDERLNRLVARKILIPAQSEIVARDKWHYEQVIHTYKLSSLGEDEMLAYDKMREEATEKSRQKRADDAEARINRRKNSIDEWVRGIVIAVFTVLLTLFVEHFKEIASFFHSRLHIP